PGRLRKVYGLVELYFLGWRATDRAGADEAEVPLPAIPHADLLGLPDVPRAIEAAEELRPAFPGVGLGHLRRVLQRRPQGAERAPGQRPDADFPPYAFQAEDGPARCPVVGGGRPAEPGEGQPGAAIEPVGVLHGRRVLVAAAVAAEEGGEGGEDR